MLKVNLIVLALSFALLSSCAFAKEHHKDHKDHKKNSYSGDPLSKDTFSFHTPSANDLGEKLVLWATSYYLPQLKDGTGEFSMRDMKNAELGPQLSLEEWCSSALEGSVRVTDKKNDTKTYNYAGVTSDSPVNCSKIFRFDVSKTKFREAIGPYGDGIDDYILAPYRTIATDTSSIPAGTVLYIPSAKGAKIVLDSGRVIIHDGYFFVGDRGGAIKGNHIDVFIGTHKSAPFFPWIKNTKNQTFEAFIVNDKEIIAELDALHSL